MFWQIYLMLCMERGLSANAVAKELSIASGTVSEWKKGRMPQNATLKRVAEFFGVSLDFLLGKSDAKVFVAPPKPFGEAAKMRLPVTDVEVGGLSGEATAILHGERLATERSERRADRVEAGIPMSMIRDLREDAEEVASATLRDGEYRAISVWDDRMAPRMLRGDVVIVRVQSEASDGDVILARVEGVTVLGQVRSTEQGIDLVATNAEYPTVSVSRRQLRSGGAQVLGRVVELRAKY